MSAVEQSVPLDSGDVGEVCIPNISTAERRKRLMFGVITFVISLVVLGVLLSTDVGRLWRLPLLLLFWGAMSGYFQWRDQTCVGLANLNSRKLGDKVEKIEDDADLAQVRRQATWVQRKALIAAIPLTLIALVLPSLG
jgi:hypothetical protein